MPESGYFVIACGAQIQMRLSYFHMEMARLVALGLKDEEVREQLAVSQSRLRVLKANPVMQHQIDKYRKEHNNSYRKALKEVEEKAGDIAKRMVEMTKDPSVPPSVQASVGKDLLDRLASASGLVENKRNNGGTGEQVTFEQILRVTKQQQAGESLDGDEDLAAIKELSEDGDAKDVPVLPEDIKRVH